MAARSAPARRRARPGALGRALLLAATVLAPAAALLGAAGDAHAQGTLNLAAGGGLDGRLSGSLDARVGLFSTLQLQGGVSFGLLRGHPGPIDPSTMKRDGDYTLAVGTLGLQPYFKLGSVVGISVRGAVGVGGLIAPQPMSCAASGRSSDARCSTRETKLAITLEAGPALHFWITDWFGFYLEASYRFLYVASSFDGFDSRTSDFVFRGLFEFAIPGH